VGRETPGCFLILCEVPSSVEGGIIVGVLELAKVETVLVKELGICVSGCHVRI
jgi:hypothetical protein